MLVSIFPGILTFVLTVVGIPAKVVRVKGQKDSEKISSIEEKREASYHASHL